jgi:ATP-binding cassette subfamily B (MDR/TAP) protein 1
LRLQAKMSTADREKVGPANHFAELETSSYGQKDGEKERPASPAASVRRLDSTIAVKPSPDGNDAKAEEDELAHLPADEAEVLKRQLHIPDVNLTFFSLFRFATKNDLLFISAGIVTSVVGGAILPLMTVLFGQLSQTFQDFALSKITAGHLQHEINRFTL